MSIATFEKPLTHFSLADWYSNQWETQQTSVTRGNDAFNLRHESRLFRNETNVKSQWDTYLNNVRLADRLVELDRCRDVLQSLLTKINLELNNLNKSKFDTDKFIDELGDRLSVISECLSLRDCRRGIELSYDEPDTEFKKELCLVENIKKNLSERSQGAWEKINRLEEVKYQITIDLNDKTEAADIDRHDLALGKFSAEITNKMNATATPKHAVTYESWLEHTKHIKQLGDNELADTLKFCESLFVLRERSKNDILSQSNYVDFSLRKKIFELEKTRNELQWQQKKMREELEKLMDEIGSLFATITEKKDALKLAETRLVNRRYRPGFELALDEPDRGLKSEAHHLLKLIQDLTDKMNCAKTSVNAIEDQLIILDKYVEDKGQALMTDIRCLDLRMRLNPGKVSSITGRNIKLTHLEEQLPPV